MKEKFNPVLFSDAGLSNPPLMEDEVNSRFLRLVLIFIFTTGISYLLYKGLINKDLVYDRNKKE